MDSFSWSFNVSPARLNYISPKMSSADGGRFKGSADASGSKGSADVSHLLAQLMPAAHKFQLMPAVRKAQPNVNGSKGSARCRWLQRLSHVSGSTADASRWKGSAGKRSDIAVRVRLSQR